MIEGIRQVVSNSLHDYLRNHDVIEDYSNEIAPEIADVVFKILEGGKMTEREMDNIKPCDICGQATSFERHNKDLPAEGEHTTCCDSWVCEDCVCWAETDEAQLLCKDCCSCDAWECYISDYGTHWRVSNESKR